jgi:hypothetical protein
MMERMLWQSAVGGANDKPLSRSFVAHNGNPLLSATRAKANVSPMVFRLGGVRFFLSAGIKSPQLKLGGCGKVQHWFIEMFLWR